MNPYAELIITEKAKLELLQKKVAACEQRIAALSGIDDDDIDVAIAKQMGENLSVHDVQPKTTPLPSIKGMRVRKDSVSPLVLQCLGRDGKSLSQIESYMASIGKPVTRGTLRTMLMNLRVNNGFVENPSKGFYKLSDLGVKAIGLDLQ